MRPDNKYKKVYFDEAWLEDCALNLLNISFDSLYSKSEFVRHRQDRGIIFWALHKYSGMSYKRIGERFGQTPQNVQQLVLRVQMASGTLLTDRKRLVKALEPLVPMRQEESVN